MHAGRPYPYHPEYWATEAWFYRGFVPFKLKGTLTATANPPWNIMPPGWTGVSDPGVTSMGGKEITYEFAVFPPGAFPQLLVTMDKHILGSDSKARWRCTLSGSGGPWATAVLLQPFPQRVVLANGFDYSLPAPPYTSAVGPPLRFEPADYDEGGSPWPNY